MIRREEALSFIKDMVVEILAQNDVKNIPAISEETALFGKDGCLDSLLLVQLMLSLEDYCASRGVEFVWANDATVSEKRSIYATAGTLADYLGEMAAK